MTTLFNLNVDMETEVVEDNNRNQSQSQRTRVEATEDELEVAIPRDKATTKHLAVSRKETSFHTSSLTSHKDGIIPREDEANRIKEE